MTEETRERPIRRSAASLTPHTLAQFDSKSISSTEVCQDKEEDRKGEREEEE